MATPALPPDTESTGKPPLAARSSGAMSRMFFHVQQHLAFGDFVVVLAGKYIGQGRFTRPVRAHDSRNLALFDRQGQAIEDLLVLNLDMQTFSLQETTRLHPHTIRYVISVFRCSPGRDTQRQHHHLAHRAFQRD